jgi:antitoxin component YwqK of YwqJK toxin-antitoxin module
MSGIQLTTELDKNAMSVDSIIKQIKESQEKVLKTFEEHNNLVNKSLEIIQQLKTETKVEVVKVKDPLEEIKKIKKEFDRYELDLTKRFVTLTNIIDILLLYNKDKISSSFKDIFLNILKRCLDINPDNVYISFHFKNQLKENILKVRDIRWLLLEMEKYPQFFHFTEDDLTIMKENGASRDNIYLVKKFLKKDGDYEEMYEEEEGGGIKLQYHMTGGHLNGEYKKFYKDGKIEQETNYTNGVQHNSFKVWYNNGQQFVEGKITGENIQWYKNGNIMNKYYRINDKKEGEYKEWNENGILMINANHKDDELYGECDFYYPNGKIHIQMNCIGGNIKKKIYKLHGRYIEYKEDGTYLKECFYTEGKLINLRTYNTSGHLELKKSLIRYDTYELSRYYECDGKLHDQVITIDDKWNGEYKSWWHNGNKCIETTYKDDKIHGDYLYWNEDGTLREKSVYEDGVKV